MTKFPTLRRCSAARIISCCWVQILCARNKAIAPNNCFPQSLKVQYLVNEIRVANGVQLSDVVVMSRGIWIWNLNLNLKILISSKISWSPRFLGSRTTRNDRASQSKDVLHLRWTQRKRHMISCFFTLKKGRQWICHCYFVLTGDILALFLSLCDLWKRHDQCHYLSIRKQ